MSTVRLRTERLCAGYGGAPLLRDVTLRAKAGEIVSLIGPNGAGKSTLLKTLCGFLTPLGGDIYLEERPMHAYSRRELAREMAVVLTARTRPELMACEEVVAMGRYPYTGAAGLLRQDDREIVAQTMRLVGIEDLAPRDFFHISDGQRQRVLLARAVCQQPNILILDEPTSFLDVHHKLRFLEILRRLTRERGIAVVMSMHELQLAAKVSDAVVCIKDGGVACTGAPREVMTEPVIRDLFDLSADLYNAYFGTGLPE